MPRPSYAISHGCDYVFCEEGLRLIKEEVRNCVSVKPNLLLDELRLRPYIDHVANMVTMPHFNENIFVCWMSSSYASGRRAPESRRERLRATSIRSFRALCLDLSERQEGVL